MHQVARLCRKEVIVHAIIHSHGGWAEPRTQLRFHANIGCHRSHGATQFVEGQLWPLQSRLGPPRTSNWKPGHTFTNWREPALPFGIPKGTKAKCQPKALAICCARYRKRLWTKLMVSSLSFKRSAEGYRAMAIAFNATLPNTRT